MLVKAFELKWSPFPRGKQIQHLNAKTAVTVIFKQYHITLKCNSPLNSREIQCPVNASSLHHSTIKCHKYVGATEAYRRNALSNTGSFLQARDKVEKERSSSLMKESRRRSNLFRCAGQAKVGKWGHTKGLGQLALGRALTLPWATAAEHWDVLQGAPHHSLLTHLALLLHWDFIIHSIRIWKESILQLWTPVACLLFIIVFIMVALNGPNIQRYHRVQPWREADEEADPAYSNKMQKADVAMQKGFCVVSFSLPCLLVPRDVGDRVLVLLSRITGGRTFFQGSRNCKKLLPPLARAWF